MQNDNWVFKTEREIRPIITSAAVILVFGAITYLMYIRGIGLYLFPAALAAVGVIGVVYGIYSNLFCKLYAGEHGFLYQSAPGGGRYCEYALIAEAWTSSGVTLVSYFCCRLADGKIIKIRLRPTDEEAADYMLEKINGTAPQTEDDDDE